MPLAISVLGFIGYALYLRLQATLMQEWLPVTVTFWDAVLILVSEVRLTLYWTVPLMGWITLRQLQVSANATNLVRYPTRADWTLSQVRQLLPMIGILSGTCLLVGLAAALGRPFSWGWGPVSNDAELLRTLPALTPLLPLPVLMVALILVAGAVTLAAVVAIVAASAASLQRPRLPAMVAIGLTVWGVVAFFVEGWVVDLLGIDTYLQPVTASEVFGLGPASGVMILLLAGVAAYHVARAAELRRARLVRVPAAFVAGAIGMFTLLVLAAMQPGMVDQAVFLVGVLQGVGIEGFQILSLIGNALLVLPPAVVLHRQFVASLEGLRYPEMIRVRSPARWYARQLQSAVTTSTVYSTVMALWALVLLTGFTRMHPEPRSLGLALVWGLALLIQVVLVTTALAFGTSIAGRVEGGAYAVAAVLAVSLPLGSISRWLPAGQPSLLRLLDSPDTAAGLSLLPLLALLGWLAILAAATAALFNRTRGELS